jgi:diguanylate cyclase (GGDEF)-like protein
MRPWKAAQEQIHQLAYHNMVSGLPNRAFLQERLASEIQRLQRSGRVGALLLVDLDTFKSVNDSLGHGWGDALLRAVGDRLMAETGAEALLAHLGADEFGLLLPDLADSQDQAAVQAEAQAERIQQALGEAFRFDDRSLHVSACIGITLFPDAGADTETAFQQADTALYDAKKRGRGSWRFFHRDMVTSVRRRLELEQELRQAIRHGGLHPVLQPIWDLASGRLTSFEVLARWQHPEKGAISPGEFIPLAEETELIHELGAWVLDQALSVAARACTGGKCQLSLGVSVNISPAQFSRPQFIDEVVAALGRWGMDGSCLKLEITESLLMQNLATARDKMLQGQSHGITFALDDFGTGYSSLAYLDQLPLEALKIDRTFVQNLHAAQGSPDRIIETILALGRNLDLQVVAEGIEAEPQAQFLRERGCQHGQGFLLSYPLAMDDALALLESAG